MEASLSAVEALAAAGWMVYNWRAVVVEASVAAVVKLAAAKWMGRVTASSASVLQMW